MRGASSSSAAKLPHGKAASLVGARPGVRAASGLLVDRASARAPCLAQGPKARGANASALQGVSRSVIARGAESHHEGMEVRSEKNTAGGGRPPPSRGAPAAAALLLRAAVVYAVFVAFRRLLLLLCGCLYLLALHCALRFGGATIPAACGQPM